MNEFVRKLRIEPESQSHLCWDWDLDWNFDRNWIEWDWKNFFISIFQMNKILFYSQTLSLSWLFFIKINLLTLWGKRREPLPSSVLPLELKVFSDPLSVAFLI
jgi:hypothetical protein